MLHGARYDIPGRAQTVAARFAQPTTVFLPQGAGSSTEELLLPKINHRIINHGIINHRFINHRTINHRIFRYRPKAMELTIGLS